MDFLNGACGPFGDDEAPCVRVGQEKVIYPASFLDYAKFKLKKWLEPAWVIELRQREADDE